MPECGRAVLRPEADGAVTLFHSWTEMGQGVHTVLQQIACEELGLPPERVTSWSTPTRELDTGQTTASRATVLGGNAVIDAARKLKAELTGSRWRTSPGGSSPASSVVDWTTPNDADEPVTHLAYAWATQVVILDEEGRLEKVSPPTTSAARSTRRSSRGRSRAACTWASVRRSPRSSSSRAACRRPRR